MMNLYSLKAWRRTACHCLLLYSLVLFTLSASAQGTGTVYGKITDKSTGEALSFATLNIEGTIVGTTSDLDGKYTFSKIPAGNVSLVFSFIGFETVTKEVAIKAGERLEVNVQLEINSILTEEVVVTGQLLGQAAAINQQINSNTIVNVVSKDKIQELPDQNAAESVGRLPGIAIQRDGGEGQKVVVRGLSPRFNSITVNGERLPSTDPSDRSVDLSFLSPEALAGIEVYKALRPDMDADAIGGTVNFTPAKAAEDFGGSQVRASFGYNGHEDEFGQPRLNASVGNRFLDNKLGILVTGNFQRANRSSDVLDNSFGQGSIVDGGSGIEIVPVSRTYTDLTEIRKRFGGSLTLDYDFSPTSSVMLYSVWGETQREEDRFRRSIDTDLTRQSYQFRRRELSTRVVSNSLSGRHNILNDNFQINWRTSASISRQKTPFSHDFRFREDNAYVLPEGFLPNGKTIDDYLPLLNNDLSRTYLQKGGGRFNDDTVDEDIYTAMLDITKPLNLGSQVTGNIKFGGKVRVFDRQRDVTQFRDNGNGPENGFYGPGQLVDDFPDEFELDPFGQILISNFLQDSVSNEEFFGGDEDLGVEMNAESIDRFYQLFGDEYYTRRILIDNLDYESQEIVSAGYIMGEFNFSKLTLLGGVRVERTDGTYKGFETASGSDDELSIGDEVNVNLIQRENKIYYVELLPQFNLKYKLTDWMDIRAAVTKSLARPNFQNLVPWVQFNSNDNIVNRGNPNLRHTTAWNYDLFLSVYNKFGLFTIGAFYKELDNIDVNSTSIAPPAGVEFPSATVIEPTNLTNTSTVMGIELDAQINFLSLPAPFDGVILSANVTFIDSETSVLVFQRQGDSGPPNFDPDFSNTPRFIPVPGQPDITANLSFGYEKGGFSGRVSTIFQDNSLSALSLAEEFDGFDDLLIRWDATASQKIGEQLQVYANFNNFTNAPIKSFQDNGQETGREIFGYTVDLGVRYRF